LQSELTAVDAARKLLRFKDGREETYDRLISTMPLDQLCRSISGTPLAQQDRFMYSSANIIGVGLKGNRRKIFAPSAGCIFPRMIILFTG